MSTSLTSSLHQWHCSLVCIRIRRPGVGMEETHRSTRMDPLSPRSADAVSAAFGGVLIAAATLLPLMILVALLRLFLRYVFFGTGVALAPAPRGVSPKLLSSLPITVYRAEEEDGGGAVECAVCLAGLEDGEEARFLTRCGHGFHAGCVDRWLASRSTCPLCRVAVVGKPDVPTSRSLRSVPHEPANYDARNLPLPANLLMLRVPNQATLGAVTGDRSTLPTAAVLVIDIPESRMVAATPRDESKSPGLLKRLWSFERQGPSTSTLRPDPAAVSSEQHTSSPVLPPRAPV